jgi:hypothetical protein
MSLIKFLKRMGTQNWALWHTFIHCFKRATNIFYKIKCEEHVKLLGVTIDYELNFDKHISEICKKSARQLNVLKRIGRYLNNLGRLTYNFKRFNCYTS